MKALVNKCSPSTNYDTYQIKTEKADGKDHTRHLVNVRRTEAKNGGGVLGVGGVRGRGAAGDGTTSGWVEGGRIVSQRGRVGRGSAGDAQFAVRRRQGDLFPSEIVRRRAAIV